MTHVIGCVNVCSNIGLTYPSAGGYFSKEMLKNEMTGRKVQGTNLECEWSVQGAKSPCKMSS